MLHFLAAVAVTILTLCVWLIFRPEAAEMADYAAYLDRKQRKLDLRELRRKQPVSDDWYWIILFFILAAPWALWSLFH